MDKDRGVFIRLAVTDLGTTEAFYGGILELPVMRPLAAFGAPEHLEINVNGCGLVFVEESAMVRNNPLLAEQLDIFPKGVGMALHFRVTEIEDINDAIVEENLQILYPLAEKPYGMKELWCFDPDGYLVVLEEAIL